MFIGLGIVSIIVVLCMLIKEKCDTGDDSPGLLSLIGILIVFGIAALGEWVFSLLKSLSAL